MLNVVVLNGGRGAKALIPALLNQPDLKVTSIVNAYDDGKSTGEIRRFFGMLGPSDIRKVQELMLPESDTDYTNHLQLFRYRFPIGCSREEAWKQIYEFSEELRADLVGVTINSEHIRNCLQLMLGDFLKCLDAIEKQRQEKFDFSDCSIMNCIYAGAFLHFRRNIEQATLFIDRLFRLRGAVIATSNENKHLVALRENGEVLCTEAEIVELRSNVRIERIFLLDYPPERKYVEKLSKEEKRYYLERHHCCVRASPSVSLALQGADIIIYSAGTQHSSLYPSYLTTGLAESIADNRRATKVFITNIGADYETPMYKASDYILGAHRYLELSGDRKYSMNELFSVILINQSNLKSDDTYVEYDEENFLEIPVPRVVDIYESASSPGKHNGDKLVKHILGRHQANITI